MLIFQRHKIFDKFMYVSADLKYPILVDEWVLESALQSVGGTLARYAEKKHPKKKDFLIHHENHGHGFNAESRVSKMEIKLKDCNRYWNMKILGMLGDLNELNEIKDAIEQEIYKKARQYAEDSPNLFGDLLEYYGLKI